MASSPTVLPVPATLLPSPIVNFGAFIPDVVRELQSSFQMDYRTDLFLTSAQLLALLGTPITIVPAPGAGLMLIPETIIIRVSGVTAAYTDAGGAVSFSVGTMTSALAANTVFTG